MKLITITASTGDPVDLQEIKQHLRLEEGETQEDASLRSLVKSAADRVEGMTNRALTRRTLKLYLDNWPCGDSINLPYPPLSTETDAVIYYKDSDSSSILLGSTVYVLDPVSEPGRVCLDYKEEWPTGTLHNVNPISIQYLGGYPGSTAVPDRLKQAIKILVSDLYENRESWIVSKWVQQIPDHVKNLVRDYRIHSV